MANLATDVHLGAGLGERKVRWTETDLYILAIHFLHKEIKRLLEVCEGNMLIHVQSFNLVKEAMAARAHGFISIHAARAYDANGQRVVFHGAYLRIAGMGA